MEISHCKVNMIVFVAILLFGNCLRGDGDSLQSDTPTSTETIGNTVRIAKECPLKPRNFDRSGSFGSAHGVLQDHLLALSCQIEDLNQETSRISQNLDDLFTHVLKLMEVAKIMNTQLFVSIKN